MTRREPAQHTGSPTRVLLVEPRERTTTRIESSLARSGLGFEVTSCRTGVAAAAVVDSAIIGFDILLTAVDLPDTTGTRLSADLRDRRMFPVCYLMFDAGQEGRAAEALATGADCVVIRDGTDGWLKLLPYQLECALRHCRNTSINDPERLSVIVEADPASTEYKRAQKELLDSEPFLQAIVANPFEHFLLLDTAGTVRYINRMADGIRFEDVIGKMTLYDFVVEDLHDVVRRRLEEVYNTGNAVYFETYVEQVQKWYSNVAGPVFKDGVVIGASIFGREITEQKEAEKKLLESEQRFRELAETIQDVFYVLDANDLGVIYVSPGYEKIYGRPVRSVYENPRSWIDAVHPDDREMILERQASLMREFPQTYVGPDHRVVRPDGGVSWIQNRSYLIRNEAGEPDRIIGVVKDITGRKEAERSLVETTSRLEALFKTFPDLLFITKNDGTILDFRSGDSDNLYVPPDQFLGRKIQDVLPPEIGGMAVEAITALHRTHEPQSVECWLDVPSGHKAFETRLIEIDGSRIAVIARDITERKTAEEEVRKAHSELEIRVLERTKALHKSNEELRQEILARKKTEEAYRRAEKLASIGTLAAGIAHEINNPLGSILMAADNAMYAIENPEELADALEALKDIKDEAKRAGRIVKTVLQFSRKDESHREIFDLGDVIRNACKICTDPAAERGVLIRHRLAMDGTRINMNPAEMEQAFVNVISNAVEASSPGQSVSVHLNRESDRIETVVADSGRGMTKEQTARIFDPFYTTRQTEGGTGLGLSLTHTIVSHHGGTIDVDSMPGEGTRVIISLPVRGETEADEETR